LKKQQPYKYHPSSLVDTSHPPFSRALEKNGNLHDDFIQPLNRDFRDGKRIISCPSKKGDVYMDNMKLVLRFLGNLLARKSLNERLVCPDCRRPLEQRSRREIFFALSRYRNHY
jgi:uncharacterized protein YbaR (Trm112 family)